MNKLIDSLNWRYATKKYNPIRKVPTEKLERILEAVRLTATTSGLQPFELLVVTNAEIRQKIRAVSWDQAQITDSSHLLVFVAWDNMTPARIDMMFDLTNEVRGVINPGWESYRQKLLGIAAERGQEANFQSAARQAYIGLGSALIAAAMEEVDATPMEGFESEKVDAILGLPARHLRSVVLLSLGYRAEEGDWLVSLKKVRRSRENFITEMN